MISLKHLVSRRRRAASPASAFIPAPDVQDEHVIDVRAPAALVFEVAKHFDMMAIPFVAAIFRVRRVVMRDQVLPRRATGLVAETLSLGWGVLQYHAGRTLVMGAAARPWARDVTFEAVEPGGFTSFAEPGLVKIVWTLEVEDLGPVRTRFRTETRVVATDRAARTQFRRYWFLVSPGIRTIRWFLLRSVKREAERRHRASTLVERAA